MGGAPLVAVLLGCCEVEDEVGAPKVKGDCAPCLFTSPNKLPPPPVLVPAGMLGADPLEVVLLPAVGKLNMLLPPDAPAEEVVGACPVEDEAAPPNMFEALLGGLPAGVVLKFKPEDRGACGVVVPLAVLLPPPTF